MRRSSVRCGRGSRSEESRLAPEGDPLGPELRPNPYTMLAELRDESPVFYSEERDLWVVTRHEDVITVVKDHKTFSSGNAVRSSVHELPSEVLAVLADGFPEMPVLTS